MDLIIDQGNSRGKAALFENGRLRERTAFKADAVAELKSFLGSGKPARIGMGSVGTLEKDLADYLKSIGPVKELRGDSPSPIHNGYATATSLGVDRLANAVAAWKMFPGRVSLVIDAGTCITYDLVTKEGVHSGGAISPGMMMRVKAMADYSARLPLVEMEGVPELLGSDTVGSIRSGVHHGIVYEMAGMIEQYGHQYPGLAVILTGGDALRFTRALKSGIFAHPYLTLAGLHALLVHDPDLHTAGVHRR